MCEGRGSNSGSVGTCAAIANQVIAVVALGGFDTSQRFAGRHDRAPAYAEEMGDQRFDIVHGARLGRRGGQRMLGIAWAAGHVVYALLDDAQTLTHLFDMYDGAVETIAGFAGGYVEFELAVTGVGLVFSPIPFETGCAEVRAGHAPLDGLVDGAAADVFRASFKQAVPNDGAIVFVEAGGEICEQIADNFFPTFGQVLRYTSYSETVWMHARAADGFAYSEGPLAIIEGIKNRRHPANVGCERAVPDELADDAKELRHHDADHLAAWRDGDAGELLEGGEIGEIVHHAAEIIDAVGVGA